MTGGLDFDGVDDFLLATYGSTSSTNLYAFNVVATAPNSTINQTFLGTRATSGVYSGADAWFFKRRSGLNNELSLSAGTTGVLLSPSPVTESQAIFSAYSDGSTAKLYADGSELDSQSTSSVQTKDLIIGNRADLNPVWLDGQINEIIVYYSDQSATRTGIEDNINAHYNIYP